jgi:hypothetical protein
VARNGSALLAAAGEPTQGTRYTNGAGGDDRGQDFQTESPAAPLYSGGEGATILDMGHRDTGGGKAINGTDLAVDGHLRGLELEDWVEFFLMAVGAAKLSLCLWLVAAAVWFVPWERWVMKWLWHG